LIDLHQSSSVGVIGVACRLPGALNEPAFHAILDEGACTVSSSPTGRWNIGRHLHSSATEPGFSYSFAGGFLENPFAFDPKVFGLSPREAGQMDPQQRLLLEVVWEALENAWIPPSSLAGGEVGVYVGASSLDYGNLHAADPASIDSHFMTGNTLSVVANRISYVYDLRGPSFTVDTACSSSMVALAQALGDIRAGRIDTAIVAGVNVLLSPASYVGFSRASMLSPTGLCRPFSAAADGYVRAEGVIAIVLQRADRARPGSIRAIVEAAGVNSDGRTSGIALPGLDGQVALLERVYGDLGFGGEALAFVEAHGTGTRVGDPIEATAIGRVLGRGRSRPLPIGSVKSNIGHLEPAAGLAGLIKGIHALETRRLPATLHVDEVNPAIDFDGLGLVPAVVPIDLDREATDLRCGVSSFGFGGTNAHVVLRCAPPVAEATDVAATSTRLVISAAGRDALRAAAGAAATVLATGVDPVRFAAATASGRDRLKHRAVVPLDAPDMVGAALEVFAAGGADARVIEGSAPERGAKVCFVYSGNGAQWAGMGRAGFTRNAAFRRRFEEIDAVFMRLAGRSLVDDLFLPDLAERLEFGAFTQPLIFAIQSATTAGLAAAGLVPDVVIGHSVGELAAAEAAGCLSIEDALRVVVARSGCQEAVHGKGTMAVLAAGRAAVADLLAALGRDDVEIAADNGPASVTISGSMDGVGAVVRAARRSRIAGRLLDLKYPFHSRFLDGLDQPMLAALGEIRPRPARIALVSTVTGQSIGDRLLDAVHWWKNVRDPVLFRDGLERTAEIGARLYIEIGPKPILLSPIASTLKEIGIDARVVPSLSVGDDDEATDPITLVVARALANGADRLDGGDPRSPIDRSLMLPTYPWQQTEFRFSETSERLDVFGNAPTHPLIGSRLAQGQHEWRNLLDARLIPYLADHVVDGGIVVPAAALAEMLLAVARELKPEGPIGFEDFDIPAPLVLPNEGMRELSARHAETTGFVELWSRPRFGPDEWTLHARGRLVAIASVQRPAPPPGETATVEVADAIYAAAAKAGVDYGPAFRLVIDAVHDGKTMDVRLAPLPGPGTGWHTRPQLLHPTLFDAALHPLFALARTDPHSRRAYLPVRISRFALHRDFAEPTGARLRVEREATDSLTVSVWLFDADGEVLAEAQGLLLRSVVFERSDVEDDHFHIELQPIERAGPPLDVAAIACETLGAIEPSTVDDGWLMLRGHMRTVAHRVLGAIAGGRRFDPAAAVAAGRLAPAALPFAHMLVDELVVAGLAETDGSVAVLAASTGLPSPEAILATFAADFPDSPAELLLAARVATALPTFLADGRPIEHRTAVVERFEANTRLAATIRTAVERIVARLVAEAGDLPPRLVVAVPGHRCVLPGLMSQARRRRLSVTVAGIDEKRIDRLAADLSADSGIETRVLEPRSERSAAFDLALVHDFRSETGDDLLVRLAAQMTESGVILVIQPPRDPLFDFYFGTAADWFERSVDPSLPIGRVPTLSETRRRLERAGLQPIGETSLGDELGTILLARRPDRPAEAVSHGPVRIDVDDADGAALAAALDEVLAAAGPVTAGPVEHLVIVSAGRGDDRRRTERAIARIGRAAAEGETETASRLRVVIRSGVGADTDPVGEAVRDFCRVVLNERAACDIRLLDIDPSLDPATAARRLAEWLGDSAPEREVSLGPAGFAVGRVVRGLPIAAASRSTPEAMELWFPRRGALRHFTWRPKVRRAPGPGEIELEVIATGLNFRDVMLAMGLLEDDVLDDGLAGSVYGFECVGRVVRVGSGIGERATGDIVFGFAAAAFATHVTAPSAAFQSLPRGVAPEAAAGIAVAFLTAWYGLVELARLRKGESVLVHGAAGGVGLAAMQIARARGARVIATASSPDKRALVELFGAEVVYDSRSLAFADAIRADLGGVDVVLNSLSGDAMRAGVKCLKPFGRFVELGKRDYVANTELGLRPFRRNLTYFGVDVDQLLVHNPAVVDRGLEELVAGFDDGRYTALPYRLYGAAEIGEAFRLMQSAGHVGKIVVRPPDLAGLTVSMPPDQPFRPVGVQLVVGGTGGFGFETTSWLVEAGARRVVVASRRGRLEPEAEARVAALTARGIVFDVEKVDATDLADVEALVARVAARRGPIGGVWHTAMVLDDGLLADLDEARIARVLAPKIDGAANLDRATRGQPIEHFVMFSSAAALIGNPGQAAYAAANGWLQGLARRRRGEGLPALAVGWGAISDVGALARDHETAKKLARATGVAGLTSAEALKRLARILALGDRLADPVVWCARFQRIGALRDLPIIRSPAFLGLWGGEETGDEAPTDLADLIAGKSDAEAQRLLGELIAGEVARILRLSPSEVDLGKSFVELGLDSLMALELRMSMETKYGVELPLVAVTSVKNLHGLTRRMMTTLQRGPQADAREIDPTDTSLIAAHGGDEEAFLGLADEIEAQRAKTEVAP
jgi:acyl transferase domain-containing protein/NADPH:quinone reductase-like Zn-dependent oxidoreductase/acyl carrier protein